jgi:thymidylate kinase
MRIILEGPDCSGKTTLAKALMENLKDYNYIHNSLDEHGDFVWRDIHRNILAKHESLHDSHLQSIAKDKVIIDRLWPSEFVYGNLFRNEIKYNVTHFRKEIEKYKPIYIGCLPPKGLVKKYFERRAEDNEEDFDTVSNVYDMYEFLFAACKEFIVFDYEIESIEQFIRRLTQWTSTSFGKNLYRI